MFFNFSILDFLDLPVTVKRRKGIDTSFRNSITGIIKLPTLNFVHKLVT